MDESQQEWADGVSADHRGEANVKQAGRQYWRVMGRVLLAVTAGMLILRLWPIPPKQHPPHRMCLANVTSLALGVQMYLADNDDRFPPSSGWGDRLSDYVKSRDVHRCEKADEPAVGFAYNASLSGASLADIADPSQVVVIFEGERGWNAAGGPELLSDEPRHFGGDNYGFADGHVEWIKRKKLPDGTWAKEPEADWVIWEPVFREGEGEQEAPESAKAH